MEEATGAWLKIAPSPPPAALPTNKLVTNKTWPTFHARRRVYSKSPLNSCMN